MTNWWIYRNTETQIDRHAVAWAVVKMERVKEIVKRETKKDNESR